MPRPAVKQYCLRKIRKIRHRKGYGVHSPFAYSLITKVIEEKSGYYAYQRIEDLHRTLHDKYDFGKNKCRLLFRLTNRFKPVYIIECGSKGGYSTLYMQQGCPSAHILCIEERDIHRAAAEQLLMRMPGNTTFINMPTAQGVKHLIDTGVSLDFVFIHTQPSAQQYLEILDALRPALSAHSVVVVDGIRRRKEMLHIWQQFTRDEHIRVTFDLYNIGIAFCNPKLNKQNYIVAF